MNKKVAIKTGLSVTKEEGNKNIKFLESLGGVNKVHFEGILCDKYYFIDENNIIRHSTKLPKDYVEIISINNYKNIRKSINYQDI